MQTKRFIGDPQEEPGDDSRDRADEQFEAASEIDMEFLNDVYESVLVEVTRLRLYVYSLPREEQIVLRALHGLDCGQFTVKEVARRMEISVAEVREIEARAIGRLHSFYWLDEAA